MLASARGFGATTTIDAPNGADIERQILKLVAQYNSNTDGSEATAWLLKVLQAGAQVNGAIVTGQGTIFPAGVYDGTPANTRASVALEDQGTGFKREVGLTDIAVFYAGVRILAMKLEQLNIPGTFAALTLGATNDGSIERSINALGTVANVSVIGRFNGAITNTVIGPGGLVARGATGGFLDIPIIDDSAGGPTGVPLFGASKASICFGGTSHKLYAYDPVGAAWLATGALTP
jgi:hypothetical protein